MRKIVPVLVACGLVGSSSPAIAAAPALRGSVGPGDTIRLVSKPRKGGIHTLRAQGTPLRQISRLLRLSRNTVRRILRAPPATPHDEDRKSTRLNSSH